MRRFAPAFALVGVLLAPAPALACGGLFCMNVPVDQAGEKILFATDGEHVTAHVQIQYQGPASQFSWVVPVPTEPELGVGSDRLFRRLETYTRPTFTLEWNTTGACADPQPGVYYPGMPMASAPAPSGGASVTVSFQGDVGAYAAAVIQANDPGALKAWLRENQYVIPPTLDPLLDPYVAGKYHFIALKLRKDRDTGDMQPITFSYASTKPGVPIRLTGVAATPDMGVYVWVLAKDRAVPENYRHARINEARIDWLGAGLNYPQVVTEAMNEAGGQAFVTDFAGPVDPNLMADFVPTAPDRADLARATTPIAFVQAIANGNYFGQRGEADVTPMLAFLKRHVPKPAALASVDDQQYFNALMFGGYGEETADLRVDTAAAVVDLEEVALAPARATQALFERHTYLTRLYTTLSPEEMTQDPMFVTNPDLPRVSNVHTAKATLLCGPNVVQWEAPVRITLADGTRYDVARRGAGDASPRPLAMPAAARIEQLRTAGAASLIQDNARAIRVALADAGALVGPVDPPGTGPSPVVTAPTTSAGAVAIDPGTGGVVAVPPASSGGFGCAGCANPARAAGGEGPAFALVALGLLGWRWRARRH